MKPDPSILPTLFPPIRIPAEEIEGVPPELGCYRRDFGNKTWQEIEPKYFGYNNDAYSLMAPECLVHFIAGFLQTALIDPNSTPAEFLIYFAGSRNFLEFAKLLSTDQTNFLIATIDYLLLTDDYYSVHDAVRYDKIRIQLINP